MINPAVKFRDRYHETAFWGWGGGSKGGHVLRCTFWAIEACHASPALIARVRLNCVCVALLSCTVASYQQVDVTSKTEGKLPHENLLVKYDARLRDNVAVNIVTDVTNTVQQAETGHNAPLSVIPTGIGKVGPKAFPRVAIDLATTVERIQQNFCICDPTLPDCPIVFASDAFLELTEYAREEVLGRNCRFLQVRMGSSKG